MPLLATITPVAAQLPPAPPSPLPPPSPPLMIQPLPDERRFGHLPYADVGAAALVSAPPGFAVGQPCRVQPPVAAAIAELTAAQAASGVPGTLRAVSCYRSVAHQRSVFCRKGRRCVENEGRAHQVAPPGYSEHETGYAVDFGVRPAPGCTDTSECIAATPAGQWLLANGPRFGFELSFPAGNRQGVEWEPWHWRWVGVDGEEPTAGTARRVFAGARARFPAFPAVPPLIVRIAAQPPLPLPLPLPVATLPMPTPPPLPAPRRRGLFGR